MGKKYIIELLDECNSKFKGIMVFGLTQEEQISVELIPEESMTPYTEPGMEQIRKEAYKDGYETAKVRYDIQAEKDMREVGERHYQRGLSDAWEATRKISDMDSKTRDEIFDRVITSNIVDENTASEAIEKIRQYEQKQEEIQVGDEVFYENTKGIVIRPEDSVRYASVFTAIGEHISAENKDLTKTGRHFPEIAEVLQKMREGQEQ